LGGVSVQSMACKQRVIVNANEQWYNEQLGALPPVLNAKNKHQVLQRLIEAYTNDHNELREQAYTFVHAHFKHTTVAKNILSILCSLL